MKTLNEKETTKREEPDREFKKGRRRRFGNWISWRGIQRSRRGRDERGRDSDGKKRRKGLLIDDISQKEWINPKLGLTLYHI